MQTVEIGADTKSCRDISRLFKDYLIYSCSCHLFRNNSGENGGALFFSENSQMVVSDNTTITFTNNSATSAGGAIWAPSEFITVPSCFLQFAAKYDFYLPAHNIKLKFRRNYAKDAGSLLYGGAMDNCYLKIATEVIFF